MNLTLSEKALHEKIIDVKNKIQNLEANFIELLVENDRIRLYRKLNCSSLFVYAVKILGLSESSAYSYISVARKTCEVSELKAAIRDGELSISKASRIVSVLNKENATQLIGFAKTHSKRELELEVAKINPKTKSPDTAKTISQNLVQLSGCVSKDIYQKYLRVQSLLASKKARHVGFEDILDAALSEYIEKHDPIAKDKRRKEKVAKQKLCPGRNPRPSAVQKQAVIARSGGRCTHIDAKGERCTSDRWLDVHHIVPLSQGGTNNTENLTVLCGFHHDLVHQLSLPIEGQVTWLRSPIVEYGVATRSMN